MNVQTKNLLKALLNFMGNLLAIALVAFLCKTDVSFLQFLFHPATWFFAATGSVATYIVLEMKSASQFSDKESYLINDPDKNK